MSARIRRHRFDPLFALRFALGIFRMWRARWMAHFARTLLHVAINILMAMMVILASIGLAKIIDGPNCAHMPTSQAEVR